MQNTAIVTVATGSLIVGLVSSAVAGVITSAVIVPGDTTVTTQGGYSLDSMVNQNGLSVNYTSGVTDFDDATSATVLHSWDDPANTEWFSERYYVNLDDYNATNDSYSLEDAVSIVFDLGSVLSVDGFALWNEDNYGIDEFTVSYSIDGSTWEEIDTYEASNNAYEVDYAADVFSFDSTTLAQYIKFDILSVWGVVYNGSSSFDWTYDDDTTTISYGDILPWYHISVGEVAFNVEPVPEPSTALLFGAGLAGLAGFARRKMDK